MAISLSCPECEHGLKVKDELAGRKIRCPECKGVIAVPDTDDGGAAVVAERMRRKPARPRDEEDSVDEERPRKKKKPNAGIPVWVRLSVLGGLLAILAVLLVVLLTKKKDEDEPRAKAPPRGTTTTGKPPGDLPADKDKEKPDPDPPKRPRTSAIARPTERIENASLLDQIGKAYHNHIAAVKKAPTKWQDLEPYLEKNQKIIADLRSKYFTFHYGVLPQQMSQGTSNTLLAYETDKDHQGVRVCLFADGHVDNLSEATFLKTPKAGQK